MSDLPDQHGVEHYETLDAMELRGGGFVQALAFAWRKADAANHRKLYEAFTDYYREYQQIAKHQKGL